VRDKICHLELAVFGFCCAIVAPATFNLDIALVKLARPVRLTDNINVICLPSRLERFPPGTVCVTAGWGHIVEGKKTSTTVLYLLILYYTIP